MQSIGYGIITTNKQCKKAIGLLCYCLRINTFESITRAGGPVIFADPGSNSNLTYSFASLASAIDDLEFSNDNGVSFAYTPSADAEGCDTAVTDFRVRPGGAFAGGGNFTITVRYRIE